VGAALDPAVPRAARGGRRPGRRRADVADQPEPGVRRAAPTRPDRRPRRTGAGRPVPRRAPGDAVSGAAVPLPVRATVLRVVETQYAAATMRLVDDAEAQAVL